jgi:hypothetical protein
MFTGPNIVRDGLVLALDAANVKSFRGEPTTNILGTYVDPTFENGTISGDGWAFDAKTDGIRAYNSLNPYAGSYCMELTNSTVSSIAFWRSDIPVVSGTKYTMTVYAKNIDCPTTPYFSGVNISLDSGENSYFSEINSEWKRFKATYTATATGNAQFYIRTDANATQGSFLIDNFQIEEKSYATRFVVGTRGTTVATGGGWADISGNDNHGEILNGTSTSNDGSVLGALDFDGSNDYIDFGSDITVSPANQGWTAIYVFQTDTASTLQHFNSAEDDEFNANWLAILDSKLAVWNRSPGYWKYGDTVFSSGTWYHAAFVCEAGGTTMRYYVNGEAEGGDHVSNSWNATYSALKTRYVGRYEYNGGYSRYFNGKIPVVQMYSRALSASEVLQNYNATKTRFGL